MSDGKTYTPLTPAVLYILMALAYEQKHGYGIMKQVEEDSEGKVTMGPGTLYGSLKRMLDAGLVVESGKKVDPKMDDQRRIYYMITGAGQEALDAELERYKRVVTVTKRRNALPAQG
ncbi:PadR family transcriptional regulator [Candidatus Saccharibacteria bacterium]|nr:PadR family transcriptional regulator [Candidatus Saccharibacteria bacterium]MCA9333168.1 PadR family transcriptional regulator [Candidatus Saccharibacteria bacterium]